MKLFKRSHAQQENVSGNGQVIHRSDQRTKPSSSFGRTVISKSEQSVQRHPTAVRKESEEKEIKELVQTYLTCSIELEILEARKAQHEAEFEQARNERLQAEREQLENSRKTVKAVLAMALKTDQQNICRMYSQSDLDSMRLIGKKRCLKIGQEGMDKVILDYLKKNPLPSIDLSCFKDEIHEGALVKFFQALPQTHVNGVVIGKSLDSEEIKAKAIAERNLANLGRTLTVILK